MMYMHAELLWTAPERLLSADNNKTSTSSADIYSLSIVLQEILLRTLPFQTPSDTTVLPATGGYHSQQVIQHINSSGWYLRDLPL